MGIMEKKMETTIMGFIGYILGLCRDNGTENGSYYLGFFSIRDNMENIRVLLCSYDAPIAGVSS